MRAERRQGATGGVDTTWLSLAMDAFQLLHLACTRTATPEIAEGGLEDVTLTYHLDSRVDATQVAVGIRTEIRDTSGSMVSTLVEPQDMDGNAANGTCGPSRVLCRCLHQPGRPLDPLGACRAAHRRCAPETACLGLLGEGQRIEPFLRWRIDNGAQVI